MKQISLFIILIFCTFVPSFAQKTAYVDSDYILSKIPNYENAKIKLDEISLNWQKELEKKYQEIDKKYKDFQAEAPLLSSEMKVQRENEIINLEEKANQLRDKYFGEKGELAAKQEELIKPIQDEVYNAIKEIATEGSYGIIFDKSGNASIIYADPKYDVSDDVLKKLGY